MNIKIRKLTKIFQKKTEFEKIAIDTITFEIKEGDFLAIVGSNGAGKSTLMSMVTGIAKPTFGEIEFEDLITLTNKTKKKKLINITNTISMSFQNPNLQIFKPTVLEDVSFSLINKGYYKHEAELKSKKILRRLNMNSDYYHRSPYQLSAGEKRKIILASLLVSNPKVLVFDEPTANLDEETSTNFMDLLVDLNTREKKTIIFISHNIDIVKMYAKKVLTLEKGKIIYYGDLKGANL